MLFEPAIQLAFRTVNGAETMPGKAAQSLSSRNAQANLRAEMQNHVAPMRAITVFEEIDALPGAEHQPAVADGNADRNLVQRRLYVSRHVVRPLARMDDPSHRWVG